MPLAVISLVLGFLSCVMLGILSGIPAVICGHMAMSKLRDKPEFVGSKRIAVAGVVLGYTGIAMTFIVIIGFLMLRYNWGPFNILIH